MKDADTKQGTYNGNIKQGNLKKLRMSLYSETKYYGNE